MMTSTENQAITSIGPGTLMGNLMRQYWIPALRSDELPLRDAAPLRVMLLGERLVAFRDESGRVGLLAEKCPHRGASLFFGRNEADGLRCAYHGWKFDVSGQCLEVPCEPPTSTLCQRVRAKAYLCVERGGIVWTYMGPRATPPPLPELEVNMESRGPGRVDAMLVNCNWLQNLEGDVDMDHIPILHGGNIESFKATLRGEEGALRSGGSMPIGRRSVARLPLEIADSEVGFAFACNLSAAAQARSAQTPENIPQLWAVGQFMFPFYSMLPYGSLGAHWVAARVPMDDRHTMTIGMHAAGITVPSEELMFGPEPVRLPNDSDWFGRFRMTRNPENDFGIDRARARSIQGAFAVGAGVSGQALQDASVVQSMGEIADRSEEHLGAGDVTIVQLRKRLLGAARALAERGTAPPGVDEPAAYRVKQGIVRARRGCAWHEEL
jgi:phenylpropionate dioxygenase-like ring-hydroxylating dioxygenase large terminal subunit